MILLLCLKEHVFAAELIIDVFKDELSLVASDPFQALLSALSDQTTSACVECGGVSLLVFPKRIVHALLLHGVQVAELLLMLHLGSVLESHSRHWHSHLISLVSIRDMELALG